MPPALAVQQPGLGSVTADNFNTYVQGGALLANLQNFIGLPGMTVYMIGYNGIGDGGQGTWTWNSGLTSGDGVSTILPNGSIQGGWVRLDGPYPVISQQYEVPSSGFNIAIAPQTPNLILNPNATLATGTIVLPGNVVNGFRISFSSTQVITALTLTSAGVVASPVTSMAAGSAYAYTWANAGPAWFPTT